MVYVCSDLHGYPLKKFQNFLAKIGFNDKDFLFILGDVIDRNGDGGVDMLRWIMSQDNVDMLLGNHEDMLLECKFAVKMGNEFSPWLMNQAQREAYGNYTMNGGNVTMSKLKDLWMTDKDIVNGIFDYLCEKPLYIELTVSGKKYLLVHSGLMNFEKDKKLDDYQPYEMLWTRPSVDTEYFTDKMVILGHTPTGLYGSAFDGKILTAKSFINIDVGCAYGYKAAILRLDDLKEFYDE